MSKNYEQNLKHDRLQQECYQWLWNTYPEVRRCFWHTPNGGNYTIREHSYRKAIGVLAGVTDLVFYYKKILYMFDIKLKGDRLSDEQKLFIEAIEAQGGKFFEINNFGEFKNIIDRYLK